MGDGGGRECPPPRPPRHGHAFLDRVLETRVNVSVFHFTQSQCVCSYGVAQLRLSLSLNLFALLPPPPSTLTAILAVGLRFPIRQPT